ncbi:polysaccharide biosynthesis protein [Legionella oakridgensis]|uniref:Nucleoside-diphosphate sugar epimerase n=2 Tax=Legionella oakridgensis TaxID=29423 RepID=A0A0W0XG04_9GAMM|nr:nucleoside-diphosphate sugar epimerase/dehydratase [Legionella oakridgensis]AHE67454.1 putative nucleoside-diphosphate sugar epimerase [Legionella oakridgensis ATCC 33761 = DSM 21215]ETO92983.1 putative nucleoside-diphosphate sugar epimerase [Legionella oakridgensis RV-2-2007]KTD43511.1 nucleoside-diphosphate sugar epimerase [Legionella oakridgensis]STY20503.1 nucleoside-diphosphate sugar epimerase [Legionella longbeachae]
MQKFTSYWQKIYSKLPVLAFDAASIPIAWYVAYWLRYNMQPFPNYLTSQYSLTSLGVLTLVQIVCYYHFKVYRGLWRFSSLNDVIRIIKAVVCATFLVIPIFYLTSLLQHIPRSVLPLYSMILVTLLCGGRMLLRQYWDKQNYHGDVADVKRVLIIGAGQAGEGLVRDLKRAPSYLPIGFIDDNVAKRGLEVHGVRVLGTVREIAELVVSHQADLIFIAIPSARSAAMRRIVSHCERCNIPFRTLPSIQALVSGRVEVNALREVNIEDLLGRDQVELTWDKIAASIEGKCVLVTGGGGSIGSELCRQVMQLNPGKLLILDNSEFNLYKIDLELQERFPMVSVELSLASVTDLVAVEDLFKRFKPDIVFHAASYKHVPMLEHQVRVAVQNNVIGTKIMAEASVAFGVEKFILISTDKAVNPTNVMGTTKRAAEIYCQNLDARVDTQFITVRFGNVLGSVGSVVPLFQKQLQHGGPLTVTHPDIERYFMTISEACQLILQAMADGNGGEIFVLDMGEPIKIRYLAEQMIRLAGKEPGKDIQIKYTGLRPGEKLFEELFHISEQLEQTEHEKLFKAKFRPINWDELTEVMQMLQAACHAHQNNELLILLRNLVPEFHCDVVMTA